MDRYQSHKTVSMQTCPNVVSEWKYGRSILNSVAALCLPSVHETLTRFSRLSGKSEFTRFFCMYAIFVESCLHSYLLERQILEKKLVFQAKTRH